MADIIFRTLTADEIEARVQQVTNKGVILLLYKDARCDMALLDETVGPLNWKKSYSRDNRNCTVSIWDNDKKEWISKEDTGTESNTEKEKGLASDAFKRACFNWGLGRELYTAPSIWIPAEKVNIKNGNGRLSCYDKFDVKEIEYDDKRHITYLLIHDQNKKIDVYEWGKKKQTQVKPEPKVEPEVKTETQSPPKAPETAKAPQKQELLNELVRRIATEHIYASFILDAYKKQSLDDLSYKDIKAMLNGWEKVQSAWARYNK